MSRQQPDAVGQTAEDVHAPARSSRGPAGPGLRTLRLLSIVVVLTLLTLGVDALVPLGTEPQVEVVDAGPAVAGGWYCAATGSTDGDTTRVVTAVPRTELEPPSEVTLDELSGGSRTTSPLQTVFSDQAVTTELSEGREDAVVAVRWFEHPAAVSRVWQRRGEGAPEGTVSGPCVTQPDDTWYVGGLSTAGGARALLHIANPFTDPASVAIELLTVEGVVDPVRLRNQVVPANGVLVLDLNEFVPRVGDLGAVVTARSGRVVTEAVQEVDAAIGGVNGLALLPGTAEPAATWTIPWSLVGEQPVEPTPAPTETTTETATEGEATDGDETEGEATDAATDTASPTESATVDVPPLDGDGVPLVDGGPLASDADTPGTSWVWVSNPSDEAAAVSLTLHAPSGPVVPDLGEELTVPAGSILRISLDGLLPDGIDTAGVTLTSNNDVPVVVALGTVVRLAEGDEGQTGYSVQTGVTAPDVSWVVSGPTGEGGVLVLHLTNPGAEEALVDVVVWDGAAGQRPPALQGVTVPPGSVVEVPVDQQLLVDDTYTAFVTARAGQVVVGARSFRAQEPVDWVVTTGIPAAVWRGGDVVPDVRREEGLVERLGTDSGLTDAPTDPVPAPVTPSPAG